MFFFCLFVNFALMEMLTHLEEVRLNLYFISTYKFLAQRLYFLDSRLMRKRLFPIPEAKIQQFTQGSHTIICEIYNRNVKVLFSNKQSKTSFRQILMILTSSLVISAYLLLVLVISLPIMGCLGLYLDCPWIVTGVSRKLL